MWIVDQISIYMYNISSYRMPEKNPFICKPSDVLRAGSLDHPDIGSSGFNKRNIIIIIIMHICVAVCLNNLCGNSNLNNFNNKETCGLWTKLLHVFNELDST